MNIISRDGDQIVSLAEAKANSRKTTDDENSLFELWIDLAHEYAESYSGLVLQQSTVEVVSTSSEIILNSPVRGIISVKSYDSAQNETTISDYTYEKTHGYGLKIKLNDEPDNYVIVKFIAGFGAYTATGDEISINNGTIAAYSQLKSAILLLTNHYYENRGVVSDFAKHPLPASFHSILDQVTRYK